MGDNLRLKVLRTFKKLHRTRMATFQGDDHALQVTRNKLNEEYKKYKNVTNPAAIEELNKFAEEVEYELRTTVIQAVETKPGTFELRLTPDKLIDSVPYKDEECNSSNKDVDLSISTSKDKPK
ncbi:complex III assembly factor LYRM7 isoform X1 [Bombus affinis]|uniref:Complex III assembly factor LYRM7 isoform X1 n=2 Tax=Bombus terrestris TaxID=30195 RepID=A0A9B0BZP7_BOMTE|nr:complex III assembly factor LYRM7 isoform X1 [Bombus terrestris]XP_050586428.1 complex III assembly factor LYRM7 isoform X1 [Bombus affinis]